MTRPAQPPQPSNTPPQPGTTMPARRTWLTFVVILGLNYLLMRWLFPSPDEAITVPYTAFKEQVAAGNVEAIYSKGAGIEGRFAKPVTWPPPDKQEPAAANAKNQSPFASLAEPAKPRHEQAKTLLGKHRKQLDALVNALLERETLGEHEILEATGLPPAPLLESGRVAAASSQDAARASMRS